MTSPISARLQDWVANHIRRHDAAVEARTYDEWREQFVAEHRVAVVDDEGGRRCRRDGRREVRMSRREAEGYFLFNSLVKRTRQRS